MAVVPRKDLSVLGENSSGQAPRTDSEEVARAHIAFLEAVQRRLKTLKPEDPASVSEATRLLVKSGLLLSEVAQLFEVSRASVGRWADGSNLPKSLGFRRMVMIHAGEQIATMIDRERLTLGSSTDRQAPKRQTVPSPSNGYITKS
jgi:hypothetical protein